MPRPATMAVEQLPYRHSTSLTFRKVGQRSVRRWRGYHRGECAMPAISHASAILIAIMTSLPASAQVQNLDQDKNGPKLFAATCADCHRSARGLAKGRFSI